MELTREQLNELFAVNMDVKENLIKSYKSLSNVILHTKLKEDGSLDYEQGWESEKEEYENILNNKTFNDFLYQEVIDLAVDVIKFDSGEEISKIQVEQVEKVFNKENKPKQPSQIIELLRKYKDENDLSNKSEDQEYELKKEAIDERVNLLVAELCALYQPIFSGNRPFGVIVNNQVLQVMIDSGNRTYKLTTHKAGQKIAQLMDLASNIEKSYNNSFSMDIYNDANIDMKKVKIYPTAETILDALNKNSSGKILLSFPHFHLAMVTRRKGLWGVLSKNISKDSMSEAELVNFLTEYFTDLLIKLGDERKWWSRNKVSGGEVVLRADTENSTFNSDYNWLISSLMRVCIVSEYNAGLSVKLRIACDKKRVEQEILFGQKEIKEIPTKGFERLNTLEIYVDKKAYDKMPFFASNIMDKIKDEVAKDGFNVPIGRDYQGNLVIENFGGSKLESCINMLVAGSRSGKGVLTLTVSGVAVAKGYPIFYLDCKPDMAKSLYNITPDAFAIDGFGITTEKRIPRKINGKEVGEYAKETSNDFLSFVENNLTGTATAIEYTMEDDGKGGQIERQKEVQLGSQYKSFIDLVAYTKGIELLNDIVDLRSSNEKNRKGTGREKYKQILFVIDELEQYTNRLRQMFFEEDKNRKIQDPNDKSKTIQLKGIIDKLLEVNGGFKYRYYIEGIRKWVETTWRNFGENSQSKIAQANITLFMIFQHNDFAGNKPWDSVVCPNLINLSKGRMLLGRGTDSGDGSKTYGCKNEAVVNALNEAGITAEEGTKQGHFILRGDVTKAITTCFLVNESTQPDSNQPSDELKGVFNNLTTEPAVTTKLKETLFGDSNVDLTQAQVLDEAKVVGFSHFADELLNGEKGTDIKVKDIIALGTKCANELTNPVDGLAKNPVKRKHNDIWENIYDFSPEAFGIENIAQDKIGTTVGLAGIVTDDDDEPEKDLTFIREIMKYKLSQSYLSDNIMHVEEEKNAFELSGDIVRHLEDNYSDAYKLYQKQLEGNATSEDIDSTKAYLSGIVKEYLKDVKKTNEKIERENKKVEDPNELQEQIQVGGEFNGIPEGESEPLPEGDMVIDGFGGEEDIQDNESVEDNDIEDNNEDNTLSGENEEETEDENEENTPQPVRQAYQRPVEKQNSYYAQSYLEAKKQGLVPNTVNTTTKGSENNNMVRNKDGSISLGNSALGLTEAGEQTYAIKYGKGGLFKKFRDGKPIQEEDLEYIEKNFTKCVIKSCDYKMNQIQQIIFKDDEIIINKKKMEEKIQLDYGVSLSDLFDFKNPYWRELSQLRGVGMTSDFMWRYAKQNNIPNTTKAIATKLFGDFKNLKIFNANGVKITRRGLEEQLSKEFEADKDMKERNVRNEFNAELSNAYPDETPKRKTIRDLQRVEYKNLSRAEQKLVRKRAVPVAIAKGIIWGVKTPFRLVGWLGRRIFGR